MWENGPRDLIFINISNLLIGQRDKFLTDSVTDNKNKYCLTPKPRQFLSPISNQETTTVCSNGWFRNTVLLKWRSTYRSRDSSGELQDHKLYQSTTYGCREVSLLRFCSALPWHGYSCFFWPCWHLPSVWGRGVSFIPLIAQITIQVRFKLVVKIS
jgi:hypothetical protein